MSTRFDENRARVAQSPLSGPLCTSEPQNVDTSPGTQQTPCTSTPETAATLAQAAPVARFMARRAEDASTTISVTPSTSAARNGDTNDALVPKSSMLCGIPLPARVDTSPAHHNGQTQPPMGLVWQLCAEPSHGKFTRCDVNDANTVVTSITYI
jgi:hypothetical protein